MKDLVDNVVILTWTPPTEDGGSEVKKYHVFRKEIDSSRNDDDWNEIDCVNSSQMEYEMKIARAGKYCFAVCAENEVGCGDKVKTSASTVIEGKLGLYIFWVYSLNPITFPADESIPI